MELFKDLWRGDVSLVKTFWLYGFMVNSLIGFATVGLYFSKGGAEGTAPLLMNFLIYVGSLWTIFISVSIWQSATKYEGPSRWAFLAKMTAASELFRVVMTFITASYI